MCKNDEFQLKPNEKKKKKNVCGRLLRSASVVQVPSASTKNGCLLVECVRVYLANSFSVLFCIINGCA